MQANLSGCPDTSNWNLLSLIDLYIFFLIIIFIFLPLPPPPPPTSPSLSLSLSRFCCCCIFWYANEAHLSYFTCPCLPFGRIEACFTSSMISRKTETEKNERRENGRGGEEKEEEEVEKKKEKRLKLVWSLDSDLFHCRISNSVAGCLIECSCITRPPRSSQSTTIETQSHFISLSAWIPSWGIEIWQRCPTPTHMWWTVNCLAGQICLTATEKR